MTQSPVERKKPGRPATYHDVKKIIALNEEKIAAVDSWRAEQKPPIPNFSEAVRRLIEIGLKR